MDKKFSNAERSNRIDEVISEAIHHFVLLLGLTCVPFSSQLGLSKVANTQIGNRYDDLVGSGISGGELRRLAFAAEVLLNLADCSLVVSNSVTNRRVICLDPHRPENTYMR